MAHIIEYNNLLPRRELVLSCNHLGIFQNEAKDRESFYRNYEEWRFDSINRGGISVERVFLPLPVALPSKTPKYKVENTYIVNKKSGKNEWDLNSWNDNFWNGSFIWYLKTCKAYGIIPIFDISGYSRLQILCPKVIDPEYYGFWERLLDKLIPICQGYLGNNFFISPGNELGRMYLVKQNNAKKIIGRYNLHISKVIKKHGLSLHNILANVSSGYKYKTKKATWINTQDSAILMMTGESDIETGKPTDPEPSPSRPFIFAVHGVESLAHFAGYVETVINPNTGKPIRKYMSKYAKKSPAHKCFMFDFDGVKMDGIGMTGIKAQNCIVDIWNFGEKKGGRTVIAGLHPRLIYSRSKDMPANVKGNYREAWMEVHIQNAKVNDYIIPGTRAYEICHGKEPGNINRFKYKNIWKMFQKVKPKPIIIIEENTEVIHLIGDEEKEDKVSWKVKVWIKQFFAWVISKLKAIYSKNKWFIWGFVIGVILGIVIF